MVWGMIMNQKLNLNNEVNIDEFMESQMEKLGIGKDADKNSARLESETEEVTETSKDNVEHSDLKHATGTSVNT